jgi:hypothetical protein
MGQLQLLQAENAELRRMVMLKHELLRQRAEPILCAVIDALEGLTVMAKENNPDAKRLLVSFKRALETAMAAAEGLQIVHNGSDRLEA